MLVEEQYYEVLEQNADVPLIPSGINLFMVIYNRVSCKVWLNIRLYDICRGEVKPVLLDQAVLCNVEER
jgi:hypothetical protein